MFDTWFIFVFVFRCIRVCFFLFVIPRDFSLFFIYIRTSVNRTYIWFDVVIFLNFFSFDLNFDRPFFTFLFRFRIHVFFLFFSDFHLLISPNAKMSRFDRVADFVVWGGVCGRKSTLTFSLEWVILFLSILSFSLFELILSYFLHSDHSTFLNFSFLTLFFRSHSSMV